MRCLVLGGGGMLGHQLLLRLQSRHETRVTLRGRPDKYGEFGLFHSGNSFFGVDARDLERLSRIFAEYRPEAVVNATGIIKQRTESRDILPSLEVNAILPHRLRLLCEEFAARLVQISTDCVFSGRRGNYTETDTPDAEDHYGRTKHLGEVSEAPAVTLRCSLIGLELSHKQSLVEWFLAQRGEVRGYTKAIFSGLTTAEFARVVERVLSGHPALTGIWHVAAAPIDKYGLLTRLADRLGRNDITVVPDDTFSIDRSLSADAFARRTEYRAPSWDEMLDELTDEIHGRSMQHDAA
ncbi:MAG: SDR family oxidoreductase [Planctomycetia bacterium]|nr:SDR family oxidoreductase [Planctomycetia bacterium]